MRDIGHDVRGSVGAHRRGGAEVFLLGTSEGGRKTPCASGYMPQFYFGASDVPGKLLFQGSLAPGDRAEVSFELGHPVALEPGMRFAMREGGRTVGAGIVSRVTEAPEERSFPGRSSGFPHDGFLSWLRFGA
jgi:elongation factor Tu